jgi:hypothetical protein
MSGHAMDDRFDAVYARLKGLLTPYASRMHVLGDGPTGYSLDLASPGARNPTTWFAGVRRGKRYVSLYLMPVYVDPSLAVALTPALAKRRQGKSCFDFTKVDEPLFTELEALVRAAYERTAGDPEWAAAQRVEHGMAHRRAGAHLEASRD